MMELTWIDDFIALAETQNFTVAAQRRHTTQSAFSRRIKTMEEWIGSDLFDRNTRPITLTNAGKSCEKRIYRLKEDIFDMKRISNLATTNLRKNITTIYTTNTTAIGFLPIWLKQSKIQNYRLVVSSVSYALEALKKNECDIAILPRFPFFKDEAYKDTKVIHQDRLVFFGGKNNYNFTQGQLSGNILMYPPKVAFGYAIEKALNDNNIKLNSPPICESASAEAMLSQIRNGLGCGWVPEFLLSRDEKRSINRDLIHIPFDICILSKG